ncbi:MAG: hypothetical protein JXA61_08225 [Bacteroidales bacterium]|nr:hypothetical protein [Bacteroidales bacterium]
MKFYQLILLLLLTVLLAACENDNDGPAGDTYGSGVYIINEGFFSGNNATISYYDQNDGTMDHAIFYNANGRVIGDVLQSFTVNGNTGFIVVNNSAKVEVVDMSTFETVSEPVAATYPRYFLPVTAEKGYLTNGSFQGYVLIVDLDDFTVTDSIQVGFGPETLIQLEDNIFVCNSGGWGSDSTISVIDPATDAVTGTIKVTDTPMDIVADAIGNLWVYCKGYAAYDWNPPYDLISETDAYLHQVDPATGTILWQGKVGKASDYVVVPPKCAISSDGLTLYYLRPDGVYSVSVTNPSIADDPLISGSSYYGIDVNPQNGDLYLCEASLSGNGSLKIYDAEINSVASYAVGIMPNGAIFVP